MTETSSSETLTKREAGGGFSAHQRPVSSWGDACQSEMPANRYMPTVTIPPCDAMTKLLADKDVELWPDFKKLKCRFVYAIFEDENGYFTRARGYVLPGKEGELVRVITRDIHRFIEESKRGETRWEP